MWRSYFKTAIRVLIRNKRLSLINLTGLSIGLAGFIIIMSWVKDEISFDRFHQKRDNIFQLVVQYPDGRFDANTPYALAAKMAETYPEIESFTPLIRMESIMNSSFNFNPNSVNPVKAYEQAVVRVGREFFEIFDFPLLYGDKEDLMAEPGSVVISSRIANIFFPDINPVGKSIMLNNTQLLTVSGVADIPTNTFFQFDFFLPLFEDISNNWNWRDPSYLLLKPGVDANVFKEKIALFMDENFPNPPPGSHKVWIIPIHKTHLSFGRKDNVLLFSCIALLLLLVAAMNYINIASANYMVRIRETGIRKVLGARSSQLTINFFIETYLLAYGALIIALFMAEILLPAMVPLFGKRIDIGYIDHPVILLVLVLIVGLISSLASIYPALIFSKGNTVETLHRSVNPTGRRHLLILITIIFQFTLSIALMISTMVVISQVRYSSKADLGFSIKNVVSIPINQGIVNNFQTFLTRLESHSNIEHATAGQSLPFNEDYKAPLDWSLKQEGSPAIFRYTICLSNYPGLFNMEIVRGTGYSNNIMSDMNKFLINETAAGILGYDDPIGKSLTMWNMKGEIVGVVKDFHHVSLHREILPHVFNTHPSNYNSLKLVFIKLGQGNSSEAISFIESVFNEMAPGFPFSYYFLEDKIRQLYSADLNLSRILGLFSILVLIVSSLGIYG
ncbi:MAG: ABC transporter permease, partial [Bacteroidia bacterium]